MRSPPLLLLLLPACTLALAVAACDGDDAVGPLADSGSGDSRAPDSGGAEAGNKDASAPDAGTTDASDADASDVGSTDGAPLDASADVEAGPVLVNGCAVFTDRSGQSDVRDISFPFNPGPSQYTPNCMKVKAGQSVTWNGAFPYHPLMASGGDSGNPIMSTSSGSTQTFAFPAAGTYGFACQYHSIFMFGAIQVVP